MRDSAVQSQLVDLTATLLNTRSIPGGPQIPFAIGVCGELRLYVDTRPTGPLVVLEFEHQNYPGVRFAHRFSAPAPSGYTSADVDLKEAIETGRLREQGTRDADGLTWTSFSAE